MMLFKIYSEVWDCYDFARFLSFLPNFQVCVGFINQYWLFCEMRLCMLFGLLLLSRVSFL